MRVLAAAERRRAAREPPAGGGDVDGVGEELPERVSEGVSENVLSGLED